MSKHNNNLGNDIQRRCLCGRYMSIAESEAKMGVFSYTCPDCKNPHLAPRSLTAEKYYEQINYIFGK